MIEVVVTRRKDNRIQEVKIEGHADYADPGEDLVCAAVSAITIGIENSIDRLLDVQIVAAVGETGFLHCIIPELEDAEAEKSTQLLMEAMLVSLRIIEESYPKNIRIIDSKGGAS